MASRKTTSMHGSLQLGFIGGGLSSTIGQAHFSASQLDGRWRLAAGFFSRNSDINCKTAQSWHVKQDRLYDSWQSFIAAEADKIDAIVVLTPTPEHFQIVCTLLENNIPVICEKPLVASLEEANTIQESFKESHNFLAVTYNYSGYPMVRELRDLVRKGDLGTLKKIHFEMPQEVFLRSDPNTGRMLKPKKWRLEDGSIPTICLDLGVHLHHLAYFITGKEPSRTISEFSNHSTYGDLVDDIMMWLEYSDGMKGNFWMSKTALGNRNGLMLRLYGTEGSAQWRQTDPEELQLAFRDGTRHTIDRAAKTTLCAQPRYNRYAAGHPSGFIEALANLYCDIADALITYRATGKHENPYVFGIDHSVSGLALFDAARKSHQKRCWVEANIKSIGNTQ